MSAGKQGRVFLLWCSWIHETELLSVHATEGGARRAKESTIGTRNQGTNVVAEQLSIEPMRLQD